MSGAVEPETELRAGSISFAGFSQFHVDMWKDGDFQTHVPGIRAALADAISKTTALLDTIATLRSDNERLGRERDEARRVLGMATKSYDETCNDWNAELLRANRAEAERDTLLAQVEMMRAERDELDFLYHEGGTMEAQLAAAEAERDASEASLATMRDALTEAVRLYETYGMLAQDAACGKWVNSARAALTKEPS